MKARINPSIGEAVRDDYTGISLTSLILSFAPARGTTKSLDP